MQGPYNQILSRDLKYGPSFARSQKKRLFTAKDMMDKVLSLKKLKSELLNDIRVVHFQSNTKSPIKYG